MGESIQTGQPAVAVVITTYNRGDYLMETIESSLSQDFELPYEVVIVDDGSTDDTKERVAPYLGERDGGRVSVRYVYQDNAGLATARNTGVASTSAPFVCFVDDDDICEPAKLGKQYEAMQADLEVGLCHTSFRYIDKDGRFSDDGAQRVDNPCVGHCVDVLLNELVVISSTIMVRRSTAMQAAAAEPHGMVYDPKWVRSQDYDFALRMARISRFAYIAEPLLRYRFHEGNIAMSAVNIKRAFGFHCNVQIDFAKRWGHEIGVKEDEAKRRAADFLFHRAESFFWQRKLATAKQMCELAGELGIHDERFDRIEAQASRPGWMYAVKDRVDRLLGR